jgi:hypothetical protein
MHLRLADFDKHRLDKFNLTPVHLYKPRHAASIQMNHMMGILRNDPVHRKDLDQALKHGNEGVSKKKPGVANTTDQWMTNNTVFKSNSHSTGFD